MTVPIKRKQKSMIEAGRALGESDAVRNALAQAHGNVTRAAELLGLSRKQTDRLVGKHSLREYARDLRVQSGAPAGAGRPTAAPVAS
jgi:transcriptional regulator with GAF, ATPase, and Fis domain